MLVRTLRRLMPMRRYGCYCSSSAITGCAASSSVRSAHTEDTAPSRPASFSGYREWNKTENWCSLCKEPFNSWNEHRGKRDHVCLEMLFHAMSKEPRNWDPLSVIADYWHSWHGAQVTTGGAGDSVALGTYPSDAHAADPSALRSAQSKRCDSLPEAYASFLNYFDRVHERPRREDLMLILLHLRSVGVLKFGAELRGSEMSSARGDATCCPEFRHDPYGIVQLHGMLVLYKELHAPMLRLFPSSDQKDLSGLTQMAASNYNLETVYVLCGLERMLTPEAMGVSSLRDMSYALKGIVVRSILGQLRWAIEGESLPMPTGIPEHVAALCQIAIRMLLCEIVFCRLSEYVCRVEPVWRSDGGVIKDPRNQRQVAALPPADHWNSGMMGIVEGIFHDKDFGTKLGRLETRRKPMTFFYDTHAQRPKHASKNASGNQ